MQDLTVHPVQPADQDWGAGDYHSKLGSERVVLHHALYLPHQLPGWIARRDGDAVVADLSHRRSREIVTLDSFQPRQVWEPPCCMLSDDQPARQAAETVADHHQR